MPHDFRTLFRQFTQYVLVGGLAFLIDFSTLYVLTKHGGMHYLASATVGFTLGLIANYLLCTLWIFDHRNLQNRLHEFVVFAVIGIAGLLLNNFIIFALTDWAMIYYLHSKLIAAATILFFNFGLRRTILFSQKSSAQKTLPADSTVAN